MHRIILAAALAALAAIFVVAACGSSTVPPPSLSDPPSPTASPSEPAGTLGSWDGMDALADFAWLGNQDLPGRPTLWGEPAG